jgi:hypothetical protein
MKTLESSGDYNRQVALNALRFDGKYDFKDGFKLDFGVRNSIRSAEQLWLDAGNTRLCRHGRSDPNGCLVRYVGADVVLQ